MERTDDIRATVISRRQKHKRASRTPERLRMFLRHQLHLALRLLKGHGVLTLVLPHTEVLQRPNTIAVRIADFIGPPVNVFAMDCAVELMLYRERNVAALAEVGAELAG